MSTRRMSGRERVILAFVLGLVLLLCGGSEVAITQLWPGPSLSELTHDAGTFEESGWITGRRLGRRTLRLNLSETQYSYSAADATMGEAHPAAQAR